MVRSDLNKCVLNALGVSTLAVGVLALSACGGGSTNSSPSGTSAVVNPIKPSNAVVKPASSSTAVATPSGAMAQTVQPATSTQPTTSADFVATRLNSTAQIQQELAKIAGDGVQVAELTWNGKPMGAQVDLSQLPNGLHNIKEEAKVSATANGKTNAGVIGNNFVIYKQGHSVVVGAADYADLAWLGAQKHTKNLSKLSFAGKATENLPSAGTYYYSGLIFDGASQGKLDYRINFDARTGQGNAQLGNTQFTLNEGAIYRLKHAIDDKNYNVGFAGYGIQGSVNSTQGNGDYTLGIIGDYAQELAGQMRIGNDNFGLAATRQSTAVAPVEAAINSVSAKENVKQVVGTTSAYGELVRPNKFSHLPPDQLRWLEKIAHEKGLPGVEYLTGEVTTKTISMY